MIDRRHEVIQTLVFVASMFGYMAVIGVVICALCCLADMKTWPKVNRTFPNALPFLVALLIAGAAVWPLTWLWNWSFEPEPCRDVQPGHVCGEQRVDSPVVPPDPKSGVCPTLRLYEACGEAKPR